MALQQLNNCNFSIGGSYTSNVVSLNVVTNSYYERATRTSCRTATLSSSESISNILLDAGRLQRTAKELSQQLKLTTRFECNDLAITLDEIANETIPHVFRFSLNDNQRDTHHQRPVLAEIAFMQGVLDDFASKRAADPGHPLVVTTIADLPFETQCLVLMIRKSLSASRDKIYAALFESMASSLGKRVRCHQIDIDDFFGAQWSLPQDLCLNREVFFSILRFKFQGGPAELVVTSEQFGVFRQDGLRAIQAPDWERVVGKGDGLQLSVFVNRQSEGGAHDPDALECPQCGQSDKTVSGSSLDGWVNCLRCNSTFNVTDTDSELLAIDQSNHSSTFRCFSITVARPQPVPAPEPNVTAMLTAGVSRKRRKQEATFVCPVPGCGSTFTRSFNLKGHIRSHNEERPFLCKWPGCGKGFAREHDCKRHEQLHLNYRPFTCDGCKKVFARMDALNRHLRSEGGADCAQLQENGGATSATIDASTPSASTVTTEASTAQIESSSSISGSQGI